MHHNSEFESLVSRYLENEMSDLERLEFENRLINEPGLKEEYTFQKDVINGIKDHRRLSLKNRLDQIDTPGTTNLFNLRNTAIVTGVAAAVGIALFWGADQLATEKPDSPVNITASNNTEIYISKQEEIPVVPDARFESAKENEAKTAESSSLPAVKTNKTDVSEKPEETTLARKPEIVKPEIMEETADNIPDIETEDPGDINQPDIEENVSRTELEVEMLKGNKKSIQYKFYNSKLYLIGDFDESPYEIIEYNSASVDEPLYYLYYNGKFYFLNSGQYKETPLVEIENEALIRELRALQRDN